MITMNDTHPAPKATTTYRIRDEARNAAIAVLGPLAIHEFDFVTFQLDNGRWDWDVPAAERPLSAQVIKANGGRKFLAARAASMASTPMAHIGAAKPVKLPVPPRRMPPQKPDTKLVVACGYCGGAGTLGPAKSSEGDWLDQPCPKCHGSGNDRPAAKPAGAPDGGAGGGEQPPSDDRPSSGVRFIVNAPADDLQTREQMLNDLNPPNITSDETPTLVLTPFDGTLVAGDTLTYPDGSKSRIVAGPFTSEPWTTKERVALGESVPACNGLDIAKPDGLDLPTFLKRKPAPAKSGTYDELKSTGALRSEPVAKPVGKPPVSRKAAKAKTAAKAAKRASKAPAKTARASGGKSKTALVGELLARKSGCTTADVLAATGWPAVSMPQMAKALGVELKKDKKPGDVTRYWAA